MVGNRQSRRIVVLILFIIAIVAPSTFEQETWGIGEVYVLDAVFTHTTYVGVCWAIEWNSSSTLAQIPDTFELLFPYINPITVLVWIIGILSPILSSLVLTNRISFRKGLLIVVLSAFLLVYAPGISSLRVEWAYNYRNFPLIFPQITSSLVLLWYNRKHELIE